jgi:uncharacterized protein (DUF2235 family)
MARNIIVCCDGTNNQFGAENTNVIRLIQCLDRSPGLQRMYYDPGVGTLPEPGWVTGIGKWLSKTVQLTFGVGMTTNVAEAYSFLMDYWEPGDKVYMFGFSRGAYTVRVLAGVLHTMGLLPRGNHNLVPYVLRLYKSLRPSGLKREARMRADEELCDTFRETFCRDSGYRDRRFHTHFMGIWDSVSSVGWIWEPTRFPYARRNPSIKTIRHAVSIDEKRAFFRENLMKPAGSQDLKQYWFPGAHADVGGGYPVEEGDLWKEPFAWIAREAKRAGLNLRSEWIDATIEKTHVQSASWSEQVHNSLTKGWWIAEIIPKYHRTSWCRLRCNLFRPRKISTPAMIHRSAFRKDYIPKSLPADFLHNTELHPDDDSAEYNGGPH